MKYYRHDILIEASCVTVISSTTGYMNETSDFTLFLTEFSLIGVLRC